jgi:TonB family protein
MKQSLSTAGTGNPTAGSAARHISILCGVSLLFSRRVLVAFDTGRGVVHAQAFGWARIYLLWTFRNFHSLPYKVLNPRQQELITALYRTASQTSPRQFDDALIGTVEEFLPPARVTATQPATELSSSNTAVVRTAARGRKVFNVLDFVSDRFSFTRFDFSGLVSSGMTLKVVAGVLAAIVALLGWRQSRNQTVLAHWASAAWMVQAAPAPQTRVSQAPENQIPMNQVASSEVPAAPLLTAPAPEPVSSEPPASVAVFGRLDAGLPIQQRANLSVTRTATHALTLKTQTHQVPSHQALAPETPAESPRVQISGPPRKLVYPVCPATNTRGKVSLHAVVGFDGVVSQVKVVRGDRTLAAAAVEAVRQWRYQPSTGDASGAERETNITVSFVSSEVVAVSFPDSAISR